MEPDDEDAILPKLYDELSRFAPSTDVDEMTALAARIAKLRSSSGHDGQRDQILGAPEERDRIWARVEQYLSDDPEPTQPDDKG